MNCKDCERLHTDALGHELSREEQAEFDAHLSACERCRHEFEFMQMAVGLLKELPDPSQEEAEMLRSEALVLGQRRRPPANPRMTWFWPVLRYAASVLIAFSAGYGFHHAVGTSAPATVAEHHAAPTRDQRGAPVERASLRSALASAYARNPGRSDLATCVSGLFGRTAPR